MHPFAHSLYVRVVFTRFCRPSWLKKAPFGVFLQAYKCVTHQNASCVYLWPDEHNCIYSLVKHLQNEIFWSMHRLHPCLWAFSSLLHCLWWYVASLHVTAIDHQWNMLKTEQMHFLFLHEALFWKQEIWDEDFKTWKVGKKKHFLTYCVFISHRLNTKFWSKRPSSAAWISTTTGLNIFKDIRGVQKLGQ